MRHTQALKLNSDRRDMREKLKDFVIQHLPEEECLKVITDADTRIMNKDIKLLYNKRD
ncbi:MAG: hypothetical protein ACRD32_03280 [Nitrososphaerales archaeon]